MLKKIKILITISLILCYGSISAYEVATITELKDNIKNLEARQDTINQKLSQDLNEVGDIKDFLRDDLSESEYKEINTIILNYKDNKGKIDLKSNDTIEAIRKMLLDLKKDTFKKLIPYIEQNKLQDYLDFIRKNVETIKQDKEIKDKINQNKEMLQARANFLEEKIKIHKVELKNEIDDLINEKIDEKIENIKNNAKFKVLEVEDKKAIIQKTIEKITEKSDSLDKTKDSKKIEIYNVIINKLEKLKETIK